MTNNISSRCHRNLTRNSGQACGTGLIYPSIGAGRCNYLNAFVTSDAHILAISSHMSEFIEQLRKGVVEW